MEIKSKNVCNNITKSEINPLLIFTKEKLIKTTTKAKVEVPLSQNCCKCRMRCKELKLQQKMQLRAQFSNWPKKLQSVYLLQCMQLIPVKRRRHGTYEDAAESRRQASFSYTLQLPICSNNIEHLPVCSNTFKNVFGIKGRRLQTLQEKLKLQINVVETVEKLAAENVAILETKTDNIQNSYTPQTEVAQKQTLDIKSLSKKLVKIAEKPVAQIHSNNSIDTLARQIQKTKCTLQPNSSSLTFAEESETICKCPFLCQEVMVTTMHSLAKQFALLSRKEQGEYLMQNMQLSPVKRRRNGTYYSRRQATFFYTIPNGRGHIPVCSKTFKQVFSITHRRIQTLQTKMKKLSVLINNEVDSSTEMQNTTTSTEDVAMEEVGDH